MHAQACSMYEAEAKAENDAFEVSQFEHRKRSLEQQHQRLSGLTTTLQQLTLESMEEARFVAETVAWRQHFANVAAEQDAASRRQSFLREQHQFARAARADARAAQARQSKALVDTELQDYQHRLALTKQAGLPGDDTTAQAALMALQLRQIQRAHALHASQLEQRHLLREQHMLELQDLQLNMVEARSSLRHTQSTAILHAQIANADAWFQLKRQHMEAETAARKVAIAARQKVAMAALKYAWQSSMQKQAIIRARSKPQELVLEEDGIHPGSLPPSLQEWSLPPALADVVFNDVLSTSSDVGSLELGGTGVGWTTASKSSDGGCTTELEQLSSISAGVPKMLSPPSVIHEGSAESMPEQLSDSARRALQREDRMAEAAASELQRAVNELEEAGGQTITAAQKKSVRIGRVMLQTMQEQATAQERDRVATQAAATAEAAALAHQLKGDMQELQANHLAELTELAAKWEAAEEKLHARHREERHELRDKHTDELEDAQAADRADLQAIKLALFGSDADSPA